MTTFEVFYMNAEFDITVDVIKTNFDIEENSSTDFEEVIKLKSISDFKIGDLYIELTSAQKKKITDHFEQIKNS